MCSVKLLKTTKISVAKSSQNEVGNHKQQLCYINSGFKAYAGITVNMTNLRLHGLYTELNLYSAVLLLKDTTREAKRLMF